MNTVMIPEGRFLMGDAFQEGNVFDNESPQQWVDVAPFALADTPVTNAEFQRFVAETHYVTEAEKFGWSFVFHLLLDPSQRYQNGKAISWWVPVEGACWHRPEGMGSHIEDRMDHPVVHVSRNDAVQYCLWADLRLPTEAEWEFAARAGTTTRFPWGDELVQHGHHHANLWQGTFPVENTREDGYLGTAPVKTFRPNRFGLYQMIGNVWEWCANPAKVALTAFTQLTPQEFWQNHQGLSDADYAIRGGSFLCHCSYCNRYRVAARHRNTGQSSSSNLSFRCVRDIV